MSGHTVLAALWLSLGQYGVSQFTGPGCDNGKLSLDRDLSAGAVYWHCPMSASPQSAQTRPAVDTVYDPEPARQTCMDKSISYNQIIPNSGAYRPVRAESGEYVYCPPQRWLNNLHAGATVVLYHPCLPLHERLLLSALARACLSDFVMSTHPQLSPHTPMALVSWGRTLALSTLSSVEVCDWLESTASTSKKSSGSATSWTYNLLLTRSAEQRPQGRATTQESVRRCCERTISSSRASEAQLQSHTKTESFKPEEGKSRRIRAALRETKQAPITGERQNAVTRVSSFRLNSTDGTALLGTNDTEEHNGTLPPPPDPESVKSPSKIRNTNEGLTPGPTHASEIPAAAQQPRPNNPTDPSASLDVPTTNSELKKNTGRPKALAYRVKYERKHSRGKKENEIDSGERDGGKDTTKGEALVDVKERELKHKQTYLDGSHYHHHQSKKTGYGSVSESESRPEHRDARPPASRAPNSDPGATEANTALPRTPRTDEAVWAAAALGFLLVLLTLSVLHTRLYRQWRTAPSMYWHDPRQDYDSVEDVIRRRLRTPDRRRKRSRRQECVPLPSSSSSDESDL